MSIKLDGYKVKIGDKVFDILKGWGKVSSITFHPQFPIAVDFEYSSECSYTLEGKYLLQDNQRRLYWDEPKFVIPKKPKPKVNKYLVVFRSSLGYGISSNYYKDKEDFVSKMGNLTFVHLILESVISV